MTVATILNGDWQIDFDDENNGGNAVAGLRMIRRTSGASETIYDTVTLYSAVAEAMDDFTSMGFKNPILPVTPNAFTLENKYFLPRRDTEYLKDGALEADWGVVSGDGCYMKQWIGGTAPVDGDIGRQVVEATSGDTGTLLDYETLPNGNTVIWIRPDTSGDTFALTTAVSCTADGGTLSSTTSAAAVSGTSLYPSIQVIGSVPTATEVYLYQERLKMTDYTGAFQWWSTDPAVSLGIIDILIRVQLNSTSIADGDVEVFAREYTTAYDNFRLNVAAGGRSALPLASAADINNTTGYLSFTGSSGSNTFNVGNAIYVGGTFATASAKGILTAVGGTTADPELEYYLIGDLTDFANLDSVKEYDFTTQADGDATCTASAPGANSGGPTDSAAGEGGTVTITLGHTVVDHDGNNANEPYSITVDAQTDVSAAKVYERIKYVTRRGADEADLFGAGVNVPGESYRGLEALYFYDNPSGTFTEGDDVTGAGGYTSRVISVNSGAAGEGASQAYVVVTDQQTSLDSVANDDTLTDESSDTVQVDTAGAGGASQSITSPKSSPFGTFTGTQIFGARGVAFINPLAADAQNYILTDDLGTLRNPPNTVSITINNTVSGDRILVARDTGVAGVIDKDQYGGLATPAAGYNQIGDSVIRVAGNVDAVNNDTPPAGYIRVVQTTLQEEHHYVYDTITLGANDEFNLRTVDDDGSITTGDTADINGLATIVDTSANFNSPQVEPGMLMRCTTAGKRNHVWEVQSVDSNTTLTVRQLFGPKDATQDWDVADTFEINKLIGDHDDGTTPTDYTNADNVYTPWLDIEADATTEVQTFVKTLVSQGGSSFGFVVNVRNGGVGGILPFTQNVTQGEGNTSVTVVRQPDTIAV